MSSKVWVALLRGINVGRTNRVAMAELKGVLESLCLDEVRTQGQSGNILFTTSARSSGATLETSIAEAILKELALDLKVMVRSASELAAVVADNPFAEGFDPKQLHYGFLSAPIGAAKRKEVEALDPVGFEPDQFAIGDRVLYLLLPNGVRGSRLPNWERLLGLDVTVRNWNTVTKLHQLAT